MAIVQAALDIGSGKGNVLLCNEWVLMQ